ncbi:hypothetical protein [Occallatibacter savannae]|uniref:hypothetical protein n=1 Tax=Occallatibacter savannae TaxID=1002691 RepID=UPI000D68B8A3|nr:hypothetical protein [Occallatibacter savannae]
MEIMLKDVTIDLDNGLEAKRFLVRCMRRTSKYRPGSYGILDLLTNTFVMRHSISRDAAKQALNSCTVAHYNHWARAVDNLLKRQASRGY